MPYRKKTLKLYLTDPAQNKDREYHIIVEADSCGTKYFVYGMNGPRGKANTKQLKTPTPVSLSQAESWFNILLDEKRKKGYTSDFSGAPHNGAWGHQADVEGVVGPALEHLSWVNSLTSAEFDGVLDQRDTVLQEMPTGVRILTEITAGGIRLKDVLMDASWQLPTKVQAALTRTFEGWMLDGIYDAASERLTLVDGYIVGASKNLNGPEASFSRRLMALANKGQSAPRDIVEVASVYEDADKFEMVNALQECPGKCVLLHHASGAYDTTLTEKDATVAVVYTF